MPVGGPRRFETSAACKPMVAYFGAVRMKSWGNKQVNIEYDCIAHVRKRFLNRTLYSNTGVWFGHLYIDF